MGQYFVAVNLDRREFVHPWQVGSGAKLWEICANPMAGALAYLLRQSSQTGGGDIADPESAEHAGRWAGDRVILVGDYDDSGFYQRACEEFSDISIPLAEEYNRFIDLDELKLRVHDGGGDEREG